MNRTAKKNEVHVGFLFASPICIKDQNVRSTKYTEETPMEKLKEALLNHYKKDGLTEQEAK